MTQDNETPETRKNRLATELAMVFHAAFREYSTQQGIPQADENHDFFKNAKGYQDRLVYACSKVLAVTQPDLNGYTVGLDRLVAFVDGLKAAGWTLLPSHTDTVSEVVKGYANLQLKAEFMKTGTIIFKATAFDDIPSLALKKDETAVINIPDFDSIVVNLLQLTTQTQERIKEAEKTAS